MESSNFYWFNFIIFGASFVILKELGIISFFFAISTLFYGAFVLYEMLMERVNRTIDIKRTRRRYK